MDILVYTGMGIAIYFVGFLIIFSMMNCEFGEDNASDFNKLYPRLCLVFWPITLCVTIVFFVFVAIFYGPYAFVMFIWKGPKYFEKKGNKNAK